MHRALLQAAAEAAAQQEGETPDAAAPAAASSASPSASSSAAASLPPPGSRPTPQLYVAVALVAIMAAATVALAVGCKTLLFALRLKRGEVRLLPDPRAAAAPPTATTTPRPAGARSPPNPAATRRRRTPQSVVDGIPLATFSEMGARGAGGGEQKAEAADAAADAADAEAPAPEPAPVLASCCVICLNDFASADAVRVLPCGHYEFHQACVDEWLTRRDDCCPLCKVSVAGVAATSAAAAGGAAREGDERSELSQATIVVGAVV
jgi:hypothetical protein